MNIFFQKIWCECGRRRIGEGPQRGKHLYYRCTDRAYSFPLKPSCKLGGINARISDNLVWDKISKLMSSTELMTMQIERWVKKKKEDMQFSFTDIYPLSKEILKLREQEERYNKAYGMGFYNFEELLEYVEPVRERIKVLESQIAEINSQKNMINTSIVPSKKDIELFAEKIKEILGDLNFGLKKAIVLNVVEKIIATQERLQVCGYIPISLENYVELKTSHRNRRSAECGEIDAF
jgi:site-specific DNA recombinase